MRALKLLYQNLDQFRKRFIVIFLVGLIDGCITFSIPLLLAKYSENSISIAGFKTLTIQITILYFTSLGLQWAMRKIGEALGPQFSVYVRLKYFNSLESLSVTKLTEHHSGYVLSQINRVAEGLSSLTTEIFWGLAKSISNLVLFFYFTARASTTIAIFNFIVLTIFTAFSTVLSRKMVPLISAQNITKASLLERYSDFMANLLTVKKLGIHDFAEKLLLKQSDDNYREIRRVQSFHAFRWLWLHSLFGISFIATIAFLLYQISGGTLPVSILILFIATFSVVRGNVERLSENFKSLLEMNAYVETLNEIIKLDQQKPLPTAAKENWHQIILKDLAFRYPSNNIEIRIPEFHLQKGEKVFIAGASGEGKTTFLNILANFYEPQKGSREIDYQTYEKIPLSFFRTHFAIISQDVELFNLSLKENLCLGHTFPEKQLTEKLRLVMLDDWQKNLELGTETILGEKAIKLSAGQKQRINILRGLLLEREIYLFDEPTAHLDLATEKAIVALLKDFLATKTAVIVAHRENLRELCSRTYEMKNNILAPVN